MPTPSIDPRRAARTLLRLLKWLPVAAVAALILLGAGRLSWWLLARDPTVREKILPTSEARFTPEKREAIYNRLKTAFGRNALIISVASKREYVNEADHQAAMIEHMGREYEFALLNSNGLQNATVAFVCGKGDKRWLVFDIRLLKAQFYYARAKLEDVPDPEKIVVELLDGSYPRKGPLKLWAYRDREGIFIADDLGPLKPLSQNPGLPRGHSKYSDAYGTDPRILINKIDGRDNNLLVEFPLKAPMLRREEFCRLQREE